MKHKIHHVCSLLIAMLTTVSMQGQTTLRLGDITYSLDARFKTAAIVRYRPNKDTGTGVRVVKIDPTLTYKGTKYTITTISSKAFEGYRNLNTLILPGTLTHIGDSAFKDCIFLMHIVCLPQKPIKIGKGVWSPMAMYNGTLHVSPGVTEAYNQAKRWQDFKSVEENIPSMAFTQVNDVYYYIDRKKQAASLVRYDKCNSRNLIIPGTVAYEGTDYPVTEIEAGAFELGLFEVASITLPESLKTIKFAALYGLDTAPIYCMALTPPAIDKTVFSDKTYNIGSLHIRPEAKEAYEKDEQWGRFKQVYDDLISDDMIVIDGRGYQLSRGEENTATLFFDNNVKSTRQASVYTPDAILASMTKAFNQVLNDERETYVLPSTVTYNGEKYTVTAIAPFAFHASLTLVSIKLPTELTHIGDGAFSFCPMLTDITLPGTLRHIGQFALSTTPLTSITIPKEVSHIGGGAFLGCRGLLNIKVASGNTHYASVGGVLYTADKTQLLSCPEGLTQCNVPKGVTQIAGGAFMNCTKLTKVRLPNTLSTIEGAAFRGCEGLTSISLPQGITHIGDKAFDGCFRLRNIEVHSDNPQAVELGNEHFLQSTYTECCLHVKRGKEATYRQTEGWNNFVHIQEDLE